MTGQWFSLGTPISSTNKTDRHDITEILLQVALNITNQQTKILISWLDTIQEIHENWNIKIINESTIYQYTSKG